MQPNVLSQFEKKAQFEAELQRYEEQADFLYRKQRLERIEYFAEQYEFLANEYPCPIYYEGLMYQSVYAAFQAARTSEDEIRQRIAASSSVLEAFQIAQHIEDPKEWSKIRLRVMEILLRDKFRRNAELHDRLRDTNHYQLINTTTQASSSNLFWGVVDGKGQNQLGRLLEDIRADIHASEDLEKWLLMSFRLEKDKNLVPVVKLLVEKDGDHIETITLIEKPYYLFGQQPKRNDVLLAHPSISRKHCILFVNYDLSVQLIDLGSRSGTFINDQAIEPHLPYTLANDDKLKFAKSTRTYSVDISYEDSREFLLRKIKQLESKVHLLDKVQQGKASHEELKASLGLVVEDIVMVQKLPDKVSHFELKQLFSKRGKIVEIKIPIDRLTRNTKNVAFIRYENEKDARWFVDNERLTYRSKKLSLQLVSSDRVDRFYEEIKWGTENNGPAREEGKRSRSNSPKHVSKSNKDPQEHKHHKHESDRKDKKRKSGR